MSKQNTQINPPSRNVADMLEILANPDQYRQHLAELKASHRELEERIGVYNSLEKVREFEKQVKLESAAVSKSRADAEALWSKVKDASAVLAERTREFEDHKLVQADAEAEQARALAKERTALQQAGEIHSLNLSSLAEAQAKLRADHMKHDARMTRAKDALAAVVQAIKGVEAL